MLTVSSLSVCLFVCPSRFWTSEFVRPISPWRRWSTETILMPLDRGRFEVMHPSSTVWDWWQLATSLNVEVQKKAKIGVFRRHRTTEKTDRDEISQVNVYHGSAIAHQIWPSSGKRGSVQEPPKMSKFAQKCGFWPPKADKMNTFRMKFSV